MIHTSPDASEAADRLPRVVGFSGVWTAVLCAGPLYQEWVCYAYCLMTNHYYLVIETQAGNLSKGMRQVNGVYTQRFNRRHGHVGHILQGR